jgi:hypothetical protein
MSAKSLPYPAMPSPMTRLSFSVAFGLAGEDNDIAGSEARQTREKERALTLRSAQWSASPEAKPT